METPATQTQILDGGSRLVELYHRYFLGAESAKKKSTIRNEKRGAVYFLRFAGDMKVSEVTPERADAWRLFLLNSVKPNTARVRLVTLKTIFKYAASIGAVASNPFGAVELPRVHFAGRVLTDPEIKRLLSELPWDIRRAARFCLYTGMRRGEIDTLEWPQVRRSGRTTFVVIPIEKSKSRRERVIPLCQAALRVLGPRGSGSVFNVSVNRITKAMLRATRRAKLGRVRFHDLRHTAAERVIRMHGPSKPVLEVFGWSSGSSAMPYIHPRPGAGLMNISYR